MCLRTITRKVFWYDSERDGICYKVFGKESVFKKGSYTKKIRPIYKLFKPSDFYVDFNVMYEANKTPLKTEAHKEVYVSGFHGFLNKDDAKRYRDYHHSYFGPDYVTIIECRYFDAGVIGTQVVGGKFFNNVIVADKLMLLMEIDV